MGQETIVIEDFGGTDLDPSEDRDDNNIVMYYLAPEGLLVLIEDKESTAVSSMW